MSKTRWERIDFNNPQVSDKIAQQVTQKSRWEMNQPEEEKESILSSLGKAPARMLEDLLRSGYETAKQIPAYLEQAKTEVPGYFNTYFQHPGHMAMQELAGGQEAMNKLAQMPLGMAKYGEERLNLVPHAVTQAVEKVTPEDTTEAINEIFGEPKYPGEKLGRGIIRNIPELQGIGKVGELVGATTNKAMMNKIIKKHDLLENTATHKFDKVSEGVNARGINTIPLWQMPRNPLHNAEDYFPKTKQSSNLINQAQTGDYDALRKMQSQLYTGAKKNLKSPLETERMRGDEMMEMRNEINQAISDHLKQTGNVDLSNILDSARLDWRTLQDVYYNPKTNRSLINMVDSKTRKLPKNIAKILSEDSMQMNKVKEFHPGLGMQLKGKNLREMLTSPLLKYGFPAAVAGGTGYGTYEYLKGQNKP